MDNRRLLMLAIFGFSLLMLWDSWQKQHQPVEHLAPAAAVASTPQSAASGVPVPTATPSTASLPVAPNANSLPDVSAAVSSAPKITVKTDVVVAEISAQGGDLVSLELRKHKASGDESGHFLLFDSGSKHFYQGQSGLIGAGLPNHKTTWHVLSTNGELKDGEDTIRVVL